MLDLSWQVVAGEESEESEVQSQREMRVLEAVYPRASAIPPKYETSSSEGFCSWVLLFLELTSFSCPMQPFCFIGCRRLKLRR